MQITAEITAPDGEGKRFVPSEGNHLNLYTIIVPFSSHITEKIVIVIRFVTTKRPNQSVSFAHNARLYSTALLPGTRDTDTENFGQTYKNSNTHTRKQ